MSGGGAGGVFETFTIAIAYIQSFSLAIKIDVPFPDSLKAFFAWLDIFSFSFDVFGREGIGLWVSIFVGALLPPWLIFAFDAGMRTKFGPPEFFTWQGDIDEMKAKLWFARCRNLSVIFIALSITSTARGWYMSDPVDALFLVLSFFFALTILDYYYLYRLMITCDNAEEDFGKKWQQYDMFIFVFLYPVAYLSGVTACTSIFKFYSRAIAMFLLPSYVFVPIIILARYGKPVKESLGKEDGLDYKESLDRVLKNAKEDILTEVKTGRSRKNQKLSRESNGFKAAVLSGFVGSFEEQYWWWKLFLMFERAGLAVLIHVEASPWRPTRVAFVGFFVSLICRPYWADSEDWLDIMVRFSNCLMCLTALLIDQGEGDKERRLSLRFLPHSCFFLLSPQVLFLARKPGWQWASSRLAAARSYRSSYS